MKNVKKIVLSLICLLFLYSNAQALKGGVVEEIVPHGFYGSWGVISKLVDSNNPVLFNFESRDIWILSGVGNKLILENLESGAHSEIIVQEKAKDGKTLTFNREKTVKSGEKKTVYKERVQFILNGNNFSGFDEFSVFVYNLDGKLESKNTAKYNVSGVRISGNNF